MMHECTPGYPPTCVAVLCATPSASGCTSMGSACASRSSALALAAKSAATCMPPSSSAPAAIPIHMPACNAQQDSFGTSPGVWLQATRWWDDSILPGNLLMEHTATKVYEQPVCNVELHAYTVLHNSHGCWTRWRNSSRHMPGYAIWRCTAAACVIHSMAVAHDSSLLPASEPAEHGMC